MRKSKWHKTEDSDITKALSQPLSKDNDHFEFMDHSDLNFTGVNIRTQTTDRQQEFSDSLRSAGSNRGPHTKRVKISIDLYTRNLLTMRTRIPL